MSISVILPTYKRPHGLRDAVQSLIAQTCQPDEIVIVDNSPDGDAEGMSRTARAVARCKVVYVHEPRPGVSNARNAGFAAASGRYIAFLDDDEVASPGWLDALLTTAETLGAPVVFGPLRGDAAGVDGLRGDLARRLYSRVGPDEDRWLDEPYGCGNSLVDRKAFSLPEAPFDPRMNTCGGEDDLFFALLARQGARFAWSARAHAIETVDGDRNRLKYLLARSFAFGQGATQNCRHAEPVRWSGVAFWMAVGLVQMGVFAPLAGLATLLHASQAATLVDKAVQGAGKLFWTDLFVPRFYGSGDAVPDQPS